MNLDHIYPGYQSFFLCFLKLIQCYKLLDFDDKDILYPLNIHSYLRWIISNQLNIGLTIDTPPANMIHETIESQICDKRLILITGDLRKLFYSKHYQEDASRHLFLINGFDDKKKIFYMVDGEHLAMKDSYYQQFVVQYDTMRTMYESYMDHFNEGFLLYLIKNQIVEPFALLHKSLRLYLDHKREQPYREVDFINEIKRLLKLPDNEKRRQRVDFLFRRVTRYKEVFFNELINLANKFPETREIAQAVQNYQPRLIEAWNSILDSCSLGLYLNKSFNVDDAVEETILYEKDLEQEVEAILANSYIESV